MDHQPTVLITGASSGIGRALAFQFAANRYHLVLLARRQEKLQEVAREAEDRYGVRVHCLTHDLSDPGAAETIHRNLDDIDTTVTTLVNNAGIGLNGYFTGQSVEQQLAMMQLNMTSLTHLTRLLLPGMLDRGRGGILNVASTAAFQPGPGMAVYFATKAFVLSFSEALHEELSSTPIHVSCLSPGPADTEFFSRNPNAGNRLARFATTDIDAIARKGFRGLQRNRALVIPGLMNRLGALSIRFLPRSLVRKVVKRLTCAPPHQPYI